MKLRKTKFHCIISFLLSLCFMVSLSSVAFAKITPDNNEVTQLVNDGLTQDQAIFLLELDKKLKSTPKGKIKINDETPDITDDEVVNHRREFNKKALSLDPAALKKGILAEARTKGRNDISKQMEKYPGKDKYRVEYSDGSWVEVVSTLERSTIPKKGDVLLNGYTEEHISTGGVDDGDWTKTYEMMEYTATSYAKQFVQVKWIQTGIDAEPELGVCPIT